MPLEEFQWSRSSNKIVDEILKDYTKDEKVELGIEYEIVCKFMDVRAPKLEQKINYIKDRNCHEH